MAAEVDLSKWIPFHQGEEFELLHGLERYHQVLENGKSTDRNCLHSGRFKVESLDTVNERGMDWDQTILIHLDSDDRHLHRILGGTEEIKEASSIKNGFYGWFWPPKEPGSPWIPEQVFEVKGQSFRNLGKDRLPSGTVLGRHATNLHFALQRNPKRGLRFFELDAYEAAEAAERLDRDETTAIGDYLFLHVRSPHPGGISPEGVLVETEVAYVELLDLVDVEGKPFAVARVLGKRPKYDTWLLTEPGTVYPAGEKGIKWSAPLDSLGDLGLGKIYAYPFEEDTFFSRRHYSSMVAGFRKSKGWKHYKMEEPEQRLLF